MIPPGSGPTLRGRVGGPWIASWRLWLLCMPMALLFVASDLLTATSPAVALGWLAAWALATCASFVVFWLLRVTVFRNLSARPLPVSLAVLTGGGYGLFYSCALWASASLLRLSSPQPWPLRVVVITILGLWLVPVLCIILDFVSEERAQRKADIDALVSIEVMRLREVDVARELRSEIRAGVQDTLDPLRARVEAALVGAESDAIEAYPHLAETLREAADAAVRPMSRDLWRQASTRYPRVPWERVIVETMRTQPLRTWVLVALGLLVDGVFALADRGLATVLPSMLISTVLVIAICEIANAAMRRWPRVHARLFIAGAISLQALNVAALAYRHALWGMPVSAPLVAIQILSGIGFILLTSGFGQWRSEMVSMREALRAQVDQEFINSQARGRELADLARDAARVLHGTVQSRLVACSLAIERALQTGDRTALATALSAAREALDEPLEDTLRATGSISAEVARKVALWGDVCTFTVSIDPRVDAIAAVEPLVVGRVVEEGLTNGIRHGAATAVDVEVSLDDDAVVVRVLDNGSGPRGGPRGLGSALLDQATLGQWTLTRIGDATELRAVIATVTPLTDAPG